MPDVVQLDLTTEGEGTHFVSLVKRAKRFQQVPVYVLTRTGHTQWTRDPPNSNSSLDTRKDDSLLIVNDTAYYLRPKPQGVRRNSQAAGSVAPQKYFLVKRHHHPSYLHLPKHRSTRASCLLGLILPSEFTWNWRQSLWKRLGLTHVKSGKCPGSAGQEVMSASVGGDDMYPVHWNPCTVASLQHVLRSWLRTEPDCLTVGQAALNEACRLRHGADTAYNWEGGKPDPSSLCKQMECKNKGSGTVSVMTPPQGVPCGIRKACDGQGACIATATSAQCDA
ncbi:hypothetical protein ACOMHN_008436 [Nucella lapillus]